MLRIWKESYLIKRSDLFDPVYYLLNYPDVRNADVDPLMHFIQFGWHEGRNPSQKFDTLFYLDKYPDVKAAGINPLFHYILFGQKEGRSCSSSNDNQQSKDSIKQEFPARSPIFTLLKVRKIIQYEGISGILYRFRKVYKKIFPPKPPKVEIVQSDDNSDFLRIEKYRIVPFYLNPCSDMQEVKGQWKYKVAIHLHIFYMEMLDKCVKYLNNIPFPFDLFVSTTEKTEPNELIEFFQNHIHFMNKIVVRKVQNLGRDIGPFIIEFGKELLSYDFVAKIHTKKSKHNKNLECWFDEIMNSLFGSPSSILQICELLSNDAKYVFPAPNIKVLLEKDGWGDNYSLAQKLMLELLNEKIEDFPVVEFPQGSMFWAKSTALRKFLEFPLKYSDFPPEPIPSDGTILHVLERLLILSANNVPGRNYQIYSSNNTVKEPYYECKNDYSKLILHKTVKLLSYYLPQFYPIPENDEWHGKGFTEWTKVRSSNPLFYNHYQQRIPHKDLGYYSLKSPAALKKQVKMMKCSGIEGQIFYHYWFNGKLILENPARMLLADKSIEMPFCFCWANENWTRKWDGNENEILLSQNYSEQDATRFIEYLIPFFKDKRYIKIDERPILFIYRPSSFPDFNIYKKTWQKICSQNGIRAPYIVGVLTRGATSPIDYHMDAGCERVLHDWGNGKIEEIKSKLYPYWPINGSVLDYDDVANYYLNQSPERDYTYFRSIIPSWDSTPRYGSEAYIVHNSTPEKFQEWLESLIIDAEKRLPENQQFVIINAWNEWAESAVLEPDNRFGYAYLNSIGRALSGIKFQEREYLQQTVAKSTNITLSLGDKLFHQLRNNNVKKDKFLFSIANSTIFSLCNVEFEQNQVFKWVSHVNGSKLTANKHKQISDYTLLIKDFCYLAPDTIENMLKMALRYDAGVISPTQKNDEHFTHQHLQKRWEVTQLSPYMLLIKSGDKRSWKCCVDGCIFISQVPTKSKPIDRKVSTIIRYSSLGNMKLLQNALFSLIAQVNCLVQPIIAIQDLSESELKNLERTIRMIPWENNCYPIIKKYYFTGKNRDLRSTMLNDSLKTIKTNYAAFLDYDDILFYDAYSWLIDRLQKTGKNASFGLIYKTIFNQAENQIIKRLVDFDHGKNYKDFYAENHTPIHGFLLNAVELNFDKIEFFDDMKYMEDYYLTLQIFTSDNTDWDSLAIRKFIGDYYHFEDKPQTLAILNNNEREQLLLNPDYIRCQNRIDELRRKIKNKKLPILDKF